MQVTPVDRKKEEQERREREQKGLKEEQRKREEEEGTEGDARRYVKMYLERLAIQARLVAWWSVLVRQVVSGFAENNVLQVELIVGGWLRAFHLQVEVWLKSRSSNSLPTMYKRRVVVVRSLSSDGR